MNPNKLSTYEKISAVSKHSDLFPPDAYSFLHDALELALKSQKKTSRDSFSHISAHDLLDAFRRLAIKEFGPMALTVFDYWNVRSCEDVGKMVFDLAEKGIFTVTENDTLESFQNAYRFEDAFAAPFRPKNFF